MRPRQPLSLLHPKPEREAERAGEIHPTALAYLSATVLVAAVYAYFLIFAQFGFLQGLIEATGGGKEMVAPVLGAMAVAGIAASVLAAWWHTPERARYGLAGALIVVAIGAVLARWAESAAGFLLVAVLVGGGLGGSTVLLAPLVRRTLGARHLGLVLGVGTGTAYAFCNLPAVFHAAPAVQAGIAQAAAGLGLAAVPGLARTAVLLPAPQRDYQLPVAATWIAVFLALVWLDSAAFYVIQHNAVLQSAMWDEGARLHTNALLHLVAAVGAGWLLDRRGLPAVMLLAAGLLAVACRGLASAPGLSASAYVTGVSLYSTALVFYPASNGRPGLAAAVYAIAGWLGSALGIAMVVQLATIPAWLPVAALVVVGGALVARGRMNKN